MTYVWTLLLYLFPCLISFPIFPFFFLFFLFLYSIIDCNEVENAVKDHMQWIQLSRVGPVFDGTANILYGDWSERFNVLDGKANLKLFYKNNNSRRLSLTRKFVLAEALSVSACMYKWKTWIKGEFLRSSWKCTITIKKISFILEGKCNSWHNLIFTIGRSFHSRCLYWGKMPSTLSFPIWNFQIESLSLWGLKRKGISRKFGITWIDLRELRNYFFFFFF